MAKIGACYPCFKAEEAEKGVILGKLVSANLTINYASGELYADDVLAEHASEFSSGKLAMEVDDMTKEVVAEVFGCKVSEDKELVKSTADTAPRGAIGYYRTVSRNGAKSYDAYFFPAVQGTLGNDNAKTKGSSIDFTTTAAEFTIFADADGVYQRNKEFETATEAVAWINEMCGITA